MHGRQPYIFFLIHRCQKNLLNGTFYPNLSLLHRVQCISYIERNARAVTMEAVPSFQRVSHYNGIKQVHPSLKMSLGADKKDGGGIALPQSWPFPPAFFCTEV